MIIAVSLAIVPMTVSAQSLYGQRLASKDGKWLLPVASRVLGSTDDDHVRRGSINSWDISVSVGTPTMAAAPGVVEAAGCNLYETRQWPIMQGYGCAVQIKHGEGVSSQYGHCQQGSLFVKRGDQVTQNSVICLSGLTGMTSYSHVHFTVLRNGSPVRIDGLFDIRQMKYCHLCNGTNDPKAPINGVVIGSTSHPAPATTTTVAAAPTRWAQLLRILAQYPPQTVSLSVMVVLGLLVLLYWLGGKVERIVIVSGSSGMAGALVVVWLFMPLAQPVVAQQQADGGPVGSAAWEWAYPIIQSNEGWACTRDGAYTMGGVTQGTYNRWRAKKGMGFADVCANLTRAQAKAIYYELFWVPTGANTMPARLALTVVDHYINTGAVKHLLAQCGTDVACFNRARIADYRTKDNCALYCVAWTNRVNKIRKYTGG
ncbi:MAG: hypothetical protein E6Q97_34060 [Desulfurellales bacterium]|nr:MAG: hypothetical protein E6Q97_34060 [Desulfurellales bacterium]